MALEDTHNQMTAELAKHRDAHIAYWKAHNGQTDPKRFEDGFIQGWSDAENKSYQNINRDSMLNQRKNENIARCGDSPCMWAFEHGYHEGFDSRRCLKTDAPNPAPPVGDTHEQEVAAMNKHRDEHVAYWKAHDRPTDPKRFEDGFTQGWSDCEQNLSNASFTADTLIGQRHQEHVNRCGDSSLEWAFDSGYREGIDARKHMGEPDTHDEKMAEMAKHKDAHIAYWKAHGNRPTDPLHFEDGFIQGWCDCEHNLSNSNVTVNSLIGQRHQEHVNTFGDSLCEWAFDDGYREGWEGRKCMKPLQQPTPEPPKAPECPPTETSKPPVTAQPNPAPPTQPPPSSTTDTKPEPPEPPKASECPPTETPTPQPPATTNSNPPTTGPGHPATEAPISPPTTSAPAKPVPPPAEQNNTSECEDSMGGPNQPSNPVSLSQPTTDDHCETDLADLSADHQCTSECNHPKKEGLLERIEHALKLD